MPTRKKVVVDGITFDPAAPTTVPVERLFSWVIWQFPRQRAGGFNGAVHPPDSSQSWYPAVINPDGNQVHIFGHVREQFTTPEAAARHLDKVA